MVDAAARAARLVLDVHLAGDRLLRVSRDGAAGAHAGVLEDHACLAGGLVALFEATSDPSWLAPAERLLETALTEFAAGDGGWFDTAAGAETLLARPRDPSDNASPSGHSALVHALLAWASLTGSGRHRDAAEAGLRQVHALATRAPRFAGWSLAAAEAALAGPIEVVVVGEEDDPGRSALLAAARGTTSPGAVVVASTPGGVDAVPLLEGRGLVDGRAAAYVCRGMLCRRPVTTVEELLDELAGA
jgi:uncharacterized protein YyaL (SSP411 family)